MKRNIIIAVDGPAGSGKSSVSKEVALKLNVKYIDSGAIYRTITWYFLQKFETLTADIDFAHWLPELFIAQDFLDNGASKTFLNYEEVTEFIRNENIVKNIGVISDNVHVRNYVNKILHEFAKKESIIMDGRDIGTVVFPNADLKIYLDASPEVRAIRRVKEYQEMGKNVDENEIKNQIILRDEQDKARPFGALIRADDAVYVDTSNMSKNQVIEYIEQLVLEI